MLHRLAFVVVLLTVSVATPAEETTYLLPIFVGPVQGAHGSLFDTRLAVSNQSQTETAALDGLTLPACGGFLCPPPEDWRQVLGPGESRRAFEMAGTPGRFFRVDSESLSFISANLNVRDTSRATDHAGTEIPIVRSDEFRQKITLEVPVDLTNEDRLTLRVYSFAEADLEIRTRYQPVGFNPPVSGGEVFFGSTVRSGGNDPYEPAYWQLSLEPTYPGATGGGTASLVRIEVISTGKESPESSIWAFLSITNNRTQLITTVTPQL